MAVARHRTNDHRRRDRRSRTTLLDRARAAMRAIEAYDQAAVDRLCRAIAWAGGNEPTATSLAQHERGRERHGQPRADAGARRCSASCATRCARRAWASSRRFPSKGIVKYAKPAGVIASLIPVTSPYVTPIGIAIYAIKCKDAVIFSPHPGSRKTTNETVRVMRAALRKLGAPEDLLQCVERPSIPLANELMAHLRPDDRHRRPGDGEGARTARASRPTASAPATRRW